MKRFCNNNSRYQALVTLDDGFDSITDNFLLNFLYLKKIKTKRLTIQTLTKR